MFDELRVSTPEGVTFTHELAGAGSRTLATAIDIAVYFGFTILLSIVSSIVAAALGAAGTDVTGYLSAFIVTADFAFLWGYRTFMEATKSGSLGYKIMGLRVVTQRGSKPLFWQCAVRGLMWPVECMMLAIVAFISIIVTKNHQRLGDLMTGTLVVHTNRKTLLGTLQVQDAALDPNAAFRTWELSQVSDDEIYIIRRFLDRRVWLPAPIRLDLANRLHALIWPKVSGVPTSWYAEAVLEGVAASRAVANERR